jgi:membrane protease subunit (stomatin/prohibitin family)
MLETNNMPLMTALQHWDHGFRSPFLSEIYFVNTTRVQDLKWGTRNPILCRDPEFGAVRLRAFGTYTIRVTDPAKFLLEVVGTDGDVSAEDIGSQIRNTIVTRFSAALAQSGIPVLDMAANTAQLAQLLAERIAPEIADYGLELPRLYIESISLPEEVEKALDAKTSMGVVGDLSRYSQMQAADALGEGGGMSSAVGLGAGMAAGQRIVQAAPPPAPVEHVWHIAENGQSHGPYSKARLGRMVSEQTLDRATLVWTAGQDGWLPAAQVADLQELFTVLPPPPPPPPLPEA